MFKKILMVSPAGANGNYIALILLNKLDKHQFSYHAQGTHGKNSKLINHIHHWEKSLISFLDDSNYIVIQNIIDKKFPFVIINWWEKLYHNPDSNKEFLIAEEWIKAQKKIWYNFKHPLVRAILSWFYSYKNKENKELKNVAEIKNKFYFDSLYNDYNAVKEEFKKFDIVYTEEQYKAWVKSQNIVFESFEILKNTPISKLKKNYQKAIAIGLLGMENNLSEQECWEKYKTKLN